MTSAVVLASPFSSSGGFDQTAVFFVVVCGLLVLLSLLVYIGSSLAQRAPGDPRVWVRSGAALCAGAALGVYLWGILHVLAMEDLNMRQACKEAGGETSAFMVRGYEHSYLPLRFTCRTGEDSGYPAAVPSWINPAATVFAALGVLTAAASRTVSDGRRPPSLTHDTKGSA
ncbi:hypothetical protein ACIQPQ_19880 [Streptomyces sp. NPDC091281]|uniref:hypothetical protein n=1 Tax=Streptomyces sp. NPDC091281 TaxID=3365985 RepID=UPI0037F1F08A